MTDPTPSAPPPPVRPFLRLALFSVSALAAGFFGFVYFPVDTARNILRFGGYYFTLATFVLWLATHCQRPSRRTKTST